MVSNSCMGMCNISNPSQNTIVMTNLKVYKCTNEVLYSPGGRSVKSKYSNFENKKGGRCFGLGSESLCARTSLTMCFISVMILCSTLCSREVHRHSKHIPVLQGIIIYKYFTYLYILCLPDEESGTKLARCLTHVT